MKVNFNNRDPVYVQVIRHFKEQIAVGKLTLGQEVPSRRELANMLKINPNTVQRAYKEMEEQSLINTVKNYPSTITNDEEVLKSVRNELIEEAVSAFVDAVLPLQVPLEEMVPMIEKQMSRQKENFHD